MLSNNSIKFIDFIHLNFNEYSRLEVVPFMQIDA